MFKPLIPIIFLILSPENTYSQKNHESNFDQGAKKTILENISKALCRYYVYSDKADSISNYLNGQFLSGKYERISNPCDFSSNITNELFKLTDDSQIKITYNVEFEKSAFGTIIPEKKLNEKEAEKLNYYFNKAEVLPANIGYIKLDGFYRPTVLSRKKIQAGMQFISNTDALIIDLRDNTGGDETAAIEIESYFYYKKKFTGRKYNKIKNKWDNIFVQNKKSITNGLYLNMPIYILTSERTKSEAEALAYNLQIFKKATVIGDTTRGEANQVEKYCLGNGFIGIISYSRSENAITKTDWKYRGVIPEIFYDEENRLLETQNLIINKKLISEENERQQRILKYLSDDIKLKISPINIDTIQMQKYAGFYSEFEVAYENEALLIKDVYQRNSVFKKMTFIKPNIFDVEHEFHFSIFVGTDDTIQGYEVNWPNGDYLMSSSYSKIRNVYPRNNY